MFGIKYRGDCAFVIPVASHPDSKRPPLKTVALITEPSKRGENEYRIMINLACCKQGFLIYEVKTSNY